MLRFTLVSRWKRVDFGEKVQLVEVWDSEESGKVKAGLVGSRFEGTTIEI